MHVVTTARCHYDPLTLRSVYQTTGHTSIKSHHVVSRDRREAAVAGLGPHHLRRLAPSLHLCGVAETLERRAVIDRVMARLRPVPRLPAFRRLPVADVEQSPGKPVERDSRLTVPRSFSALSTF
jgi:hypothetical protein